MLKLQKQRFHSLKITLSLLFSVVAIGLVPINLAGAIPSEKDGKVTICHATHNEPGSYNTLTVSASGAYQGHLDHDGDIVPPFEYKGQTYSQNWYGPGILTYANDCQPTGGDAD